MGKYAVDPLLEKQKKLSQTLESKLRKQRHILNLKARCRILERSILSLEKSGQRPEDGGELADATQKLERILEEIETVSEEISGSRTDIDNLQKTVLELISPPETGVLSEDPLPILDGSRPVLLLPVRLETRFIPVEENYELWIRIFPDDIAIQTHEPSLTEDEYEAGCHYIRRIWWAGKKPCRDDDDEYDEKHEKWQERWDSAWLEIAGEYGPERAAWIVRMFRQFKDETVITENYNEMPDFMVELDEYGNPKEEGHAIPKFVEKNELETPLPLLRPESWSEPPCSYVMPDFFVVRLYREGGLVCQKKGNRIPTPLHVGPAPITIHVGPDPTTDEELPEDQFFFDAESKWIIDFDEAVEKGMAIKVTKDDVENLEEGFSCIIAIGVKASADHEESQRIFESLIDCHRYTEGFSFVRQGTPTNNVVGAKSGYSRATDPMKHYITEFGPPLISGNPEPTVTNGFRFSHMSGICQDVLEHIENADLCEDENAKCMLQAIWPATFGYYLETMLSKGFRGLWGVNIGEGEGFTDRYGFILNQIREHFYKFVRGRGPLSAVRVGDNPYGVLPVTSLRSWVPSELDACWLGDDKDKRRQEIILNVFLIKILQKLVPYWVNMAKNGAKVPRAGGRGDPEAELIEILGMGPSSRDALIRPFTNIIYLWNILLFWWPIFMGSIPSWFEGFLEQVGMPSSTDWLNMWSGAYMDRWRYYREKFMQLHDVDNDFPDLNPFLLTLVSWGKGYELENLRRPKGEVEGSEEEEPKLYPFIQKEPVSEEAPSAETEEYIKWLKDNVADIDAIRNSDQPPVQQQDSLLYNLLRMSILLQDNPDGVGLERLSGLSSAELERLLGETLDLFTNRLDAYITSIASKRLHCMREVLPNGIYLGAYGWVEDLQKGQQGLVREGGSIFTLKPAQAAAGAVLRNAYLTHTEQEGKDTFAVRLTSDRVRRAVWLVDGIRQGQSLSTLLGYRFEKGLFENYLEARLELGTYVYAFRRLYPLKVLQETDDQEEAGETEEVVVPRNVVDGYELIKAWRRWKNNEDDAIPFNDDDVLSNLNTSEYNAISTELDCIEDAYDAVNDLALYESIYHNVQGNFDRAPALLDALAAGGGIIPEPESIRTPRGGFTFKHRVLVLSTMDEVEPGNQWNDEISPRSEAALHLTGWIATMLGDPAKVMCKFWFDGMSDDYQNPFITLKDLASQQNLGPMDFLAMSVSEIGGGATELEQRILYRIRSKENLSLDTEVRLDFKPSPDWPESSKSFLEVIPLARRLQQMISGSRFLEPSDLYLPEEAEGNSLAGFNCCEYQDYLNRIETSIKKLDAVIESLSPDDPSPPNLRSALLSASLYGVKGSIPESIKNDQETKKVLTKQADDVAKELSKRLDAAASQRDQAAERFQEYVDSGDTDETRDTAKLRQAVHTLAKSIKEIFGKSFVALPFFNARNRADLENAFSELDDDGMSIEWLQKAAHTHPKLKQFEDVMMLSEAFSGEAKLKLEVGQLPKPSNNQWLALKLQGANLDELQHGSLSLVVYSPTGTLISEDPGGDPSDLRLTGFIVDEWDETIPKKTVNAAITYHYNRPNTEAPQVLLLAVPPVFLYPTLLRATDSGTAPASRNDLTDAVDSSSRSSFLTNDSIKNASPTLGLWYFEHLAESVEETLDLAKIRAVDIDAMQGFGHFLPALFMPTSPGGSR